MRLFFRPPDGSVAYARQTLLTFSRACAGLAVTLKTIHEAIVVAKMRRLQHQLMLHGDLGEDGREPDKPPGEQGVRNIPQRPIILSDKWDF